MRRATDSGTLYVVLVFFLPSRIQITEGSSLTSSLSSLDPGAIALISQKY
jgi:hypothetical protein